LHGHEHHGFGQISPELHGTYFVRDNIPQRIEHVDHKCDAGIRLKQRSVPVFVVWVAQPPLLTIPNEEGT
jgi:hypothetical protein